MKKFWIYMVILLVVPAFVMTGCKKDDEETFDAQQVLVDYMISQDLDLNKIIGGFVMDTPDDVSAVASKYIIDIRTADEFAAGHIVDAHRVDLANILTEAAKANKPILVVCKSGQTATHAVALLRMSGYTDAQALKWGMSRWNAAFDIWSNNIGSIAAGHANWNSDAAPNTLIYESPNFSSSVTDGAGILAERVAKVLADGFKTTTPTDVLNNPGNYYINNYFSEGDYAGFGHIKGAYRINPMLLGEGQVNYLDASKKITTYCYTGQTSAAITAWLRVLGYDAVSMMWGMNNLYNSSTHWTSNKWSSGMVKNLPYVTGN